MVLYHGELKVCSGPCRPGSPKSWQVLKIVKLSWTNVTAHVYLYFHKKTCLVHESVGCVWIFYGMIFVLRYGV
jgi:hypothetical protein